MPRKFHDGDLIGLPGILHLIAGPILWWLHRGFIRMPMIFPGPMLHGTLNSRAQVARVAGRFSGETASSLLAQERLPVRPLGLPLRPGPFVQHEPIL
jgi:hypothetical protein